MNRKHLHRWTAWLLPLIALRAFIPVGFMLEAGAEGLRLAFCSGMAQISVPESASQAQHLAHNTSDEHSDHAAGGASHAHKPAPCPFSLTASTAPQSIPYLAVVQFAPLGEAIEFVALPMAGQGPARADRIRGPPFIA